MITKTRLFVSGNAIERLEADGTIERHGHERLVVQPDEMVFKTIRAFHFLASLGGADDWRMEGRVLTESEVLRLSGRIGVGRVHFGPRGYEVQEGVVGELVSEASVVDEPSQSPPTVGLQGGPEELTPDDIGAALSHALAGGPESRDSLSDPEPALTAPAKRRSSAGDAARRSPDRRPSEPESPEDEELLVRFLLEGN